MRDKALCRRVSHNNVSNHVISGSGSVGWWGLLTGGRCRSNCSGGKKKPCYFLARGTQELRQELYGAKDGCLILWVVVVRYRLLRAERKSCLRS